MDVLERIGLAGLVPVVVIENAEDAVPAARALLGAGLDVMEITMRTAAGIQAIKNVRNAVPEMLVGAGTVLTLEKCKESVDAGAQFIVSPGFDVEVVRWCIENSVAVTPGCVTPTEIQQALAEGLTTLKFFPSKVYGGVSAMSALHGPFKSAGVRFIPTGGVNNDNLAEYAEKQFVHAIGGGWLCKTSDINPHNFVAITEAVRKAIDILLGFEIAHIGINLENAEESLSVSQLFSKAFNFPIKEGNSSNFAGPNIEVMKSKYLGSMGHLAIKTNNIKRGIHYLAQRGFEVDMETAKYKSSQMIAVYLKNEFGGFAVHLLQK
jgi:2-dehydro-3-deoxyphosphogluconate aldolase/(4S)-4-hydroxy-2-oxoglutarate aldolase